MYTVLLYLMFLFPAFGLFSQIPPEAQGGVLDLRSWNFKENKTVPLNGEWEFYWNELLSEPGDSGNRAFVSVPGRWHRQGEYNRKGYATYGLTILLPETRPVSLALLTGGIHTAWKMYANGIPLSSGGIVSSDAEEHWPNYSSRITMMPGNPDTLHILIQVSNYSDSHAGLERPLVLGKSEYLFNSKSRSEHIDFFLLGSFIFMGMYMFSQYIFRRKDLSPVVLGAFIFTICFRVGLTGNRSLHEFFGSDAVFILLKIENIGVPLSLILFIWYYRLVFRKDWSRLNYISIAVSLVYALLILFLPMESYVWYISNYQSFLMYAGLIFLYDMTRALYHRRKGSIEMFLGTLVLLISLRFEILFLNNHIQTDFLFPIGLYVFLFLQMLYQSRFVNDTFNRVEILLKERVETNEKLEERVRFRTKQLKQARDDAEKSNKAKNEFLANMSHEMRTPLNSILGFSEILESSCAEEDREEFASIIHNESERLLLMINDLLDISRIEAGTVIIKKSDFFLSELMDRVFLTVNPLLKEKQLDYNCHISPDIPDCLHGDVFKLEQVLLNLAGNAVKFTREGSLTINVEPVFIDEDNIRIMFEVIDTGIGIDENKKAELFSRFVQLDAGVTRKYGGAGLGTSISKQLVELMGGSIDFESTLGQGSRFWFTLTLVVSDPNLQRERKSIDFSSMAGRFTGKTVYLAEDYEPNRKLIEFYLRDSGCLLKTFSNGQEVLDSLQKEIPHIVFMDIHMPELDGLSATRILRKHINTDSLPVIALTANAFDSDKKTYLGSGMNDVLTKPITRRDIFRCLDKWLRGALSEVEAEPGCREPSGNCDIFDKEGFLEDLGGNLNFLEEMLDGFFLNADRQISIYKSRPDYETRTRIVHTIKGGALNIRAFCLAESAASLEQALKNREPDEELSHRFLESYTILKSRLDR